MLRWGGILLGVGLGGFAEGILVHQLLQWHHMLSTAVPPTSVEALRTNMRADALFYAVTWMAIVSGVWLLWQAGQRVTAFPGGRWFMGQFFVGWGAFNLLESIISHHILDIHHVRGRPDFDWEWGYLLIAGAGFIWLGRRLARGDPHNR
jgi:uncharacterized membrane protein